MSVSPGLCWAIVAIVVAVFAWACTRNRKRYRIEDGIDGWTLVWPNGARFEGASGALCIVDRRVCERFCDQMNQDQNRDEREAWRIALDTGRLHQPVKASVMPNDGHPASERERNPLDSRRIQHPLDAVDR